MNESLLFLATFILYIISAFYYFLFLFKKRENLAIIGFSFALVGLFIHTIALLLRTFESGHAPFTNMYESLSFLAWSSILAYVIIEFKYKIRRAGPYFLLIVIALMALASSPLMPKEATPLVPALQSYWLWLHVSVTLLGEAFFAIAFVTSIMYLRASCIWWLTRKKEKE
jgi:ABC-type transport system involved in cytochrome c biogenesis permease subunit